MNKLQFQAFCGISVMMALIVAYIIFSTDGISQATIVITIASTLLCCAALYFWVRTNPEDIEMMMSDEPKWLVWGKNKHGFWAFTAGVIIWGGMLLEDYLKLGEISVNRLIGFLLAVLILAVFYRDARKISKEAE